MNPQIVVSTLAAALGMLVALWTILSNFDRRNADRFGALEREIQATKETLRAEIHGGLSSLRAEMEGGFASVRAEIATLRAETEGRLASLRAETEGGFASVRAEMAAMRAELRLEIRDAFERRVTTK